MLGPGRLGVGRSTQRLAGSSFSSAATLAGSGAGTSVRYHAGSYGPVLRSTIPGPTPQRAVPSTSGFAVSTLHDQAPLARSNTRSASSTAALVKKLVGVSGKSLA